MENLESLSKSLSSTAPSWKFETMQKPILDPSRLYATQTFLTQEQAGIPHAVMPGVNAMLLSEQEKALTKELLYVLSGIGTDLISIHQISQNEIGFTVDERIDASLRDLTLQITQVASHYHRVQKYVEVACNLEYGKVNHALSAAMRALLREYHVRIGQLETMYCKGELTLQSFWFHIHQSLQQLSVMSSIAASVDRETARGGKVLSILHEKAVTLAGDEVGLKTCSILAENASQPYFRILENWIYKGVIQDPFEEFFISEDDTTKDRESIPTDDYWEGRYHSDKDMCPTFLRKKEKEILKAGMYLNVILQCGKEIGLYMGEKIKYSIHEYSYVDTLQNAYCFASKTLLDLLLNDYDLMRRMVSVKHYLLMDQGDFIVQFLDLTESELCKPSDDLNETRLSSLLELALRTSSSCTDPYKDSVKVELFPTGLRDMLVNVINIGSQHEKETFETEGAFSIPVVEAFSLSCDVVWPISLILNKRAISNYQLIFRYLFFCKHVERRLCQVWLEEKQYKNVDLKVNIEKATASALRQKMLNFVQNLFYYTTSEVIEPAWHNFLATMIKVQNIDEVMEVHSSFLTCIREEAMLTNVALLDKITGLLATCLDFCNKFSVSVPPSSDRYQPISAPTKNMVDFDKEFSYNLVEFLRGVSELVQCPHQPNKVINIINRINFNGYYTHALDQA